MGWATPPTGNMAKAIANAFPHVRCSVLELPQMADSMPVGGLVEFVAGDMMESIPQADVVLLNADYYNYNIINLLLPPCKLWKV
jgi:hypothetical protein